MSSGKQSSLHDRLVGSLLHDGEYYVQRLLGRGGMGRVYLATHTILQQPFAIKQVRADQPLPESVSSELDELLRHGENSQRNTTAQRPISREIPTSGGVHTDRFIREVLLLARLHHRTIPTLYDYFMADDYWYLVMDYVPGKTLSRSLRQPLPPLKALNYAMQLCNVLNYLHSQSPPVIFRDLKPSNIMLTPKDSLMLVDFGIARYYKEGQESDTLGFGSPGYASPEQFRGAQQTDERSDLYSLGVIIHEMLSGARPSIQCSLKLHAPHLSATLCALVTIATRSDCAQRFQSAHTFQLALQRAYAVEEYRAYQQQVQLHSTEQEQQLAPSLQQTTRKAAARLEPFPADASSPSLTFAGTFPTVPPSTLNLERRRKRRLLLQQARHERREQEQFERQLASVDESLRRRAILALAHTPVLALQELVESQKPAGKKQGLRYIIQLCFTASLLLFVVLASLALVGRPVQRTGDLLQRQEEQIPPLGMAQLPGYWMELPALPIPAADNTAAYVELKGHAYVYMTGGYRGGSSAPYYERALYRYDINDSRWERVRSFPGMLNNAVATDSSGHMFFSTGYSTDTYTVHSRLYMYTPHTNDLQIITPPDSMPLGFGTSMLIDGSGHLYTNQGFLKAGTPHAQAGRGWYRYDIAQQHWQSLAPLPRTLGYALLVQPDPSSLLLLGGALDAGQRQQATTMYRYDIAQDRWSLEPMTTPQPMSGTASCMLQPGRLAVLGGYNNRGGQGHREGWLLELNTLRWKALAPLPGGGSMLGAAACNQAGQLFLVRGARDLRHPTRDFWQLTVE